ncbi:MAG: MBL fold metallo-hydrolase [Gammaproteobacteria bacterium]|jgi:ribonuclease BN (tRNA processing enzyme)|nr:MBL fold metallo-hydrolase [Gammaproteobacteria bacterium]
MQIKILGWAGGIGANLRTTSFLIDDDLLIDAGTGLGDLPLNHMTGIRHIFLTHSHMDHIVGLPLLADSMFGVHDEPIIVHAQEKTIQALKAHVFNWVIWPDFSELPTRDNPSIRFEVMNPGNVVSIRSRDIEMIEVNHTVPGVGYCLSSRRASVAFSGDTTTNDNLWQVLNRYENIDLLFVESAFSNHDLEISKISKHYCPSLLGADVLKMKHRPDVWLTHFKPGDEELIYQECVEAMPDFNVHQIKGGEIFIF